jgi:hypothetical protein
MPRRAELEARLKLPGAIGAERVDQERREWQRPLAILRLRLGEQPRAINALYLLTHRDGGSNSACARARKEQLQEQRFDRHGLAVTVCHYPTGCSKWNPMEHRLFEPISLNWAGRPLTTWDTLLGYLRGTTTDTGLTVRAAHPIPGAE